MAQSDKQQSGGTQIQRGRPQRMLTPFDEMERMFGDLLPSRMLSPMRGMFPTELMGADTRLPRVDVIEQDNDILLRAEVPGVKKDDLDISVDDNTVTIRGSSEHEEKIEEGDFYRCEISRGGFVRTVTLPSPVNSEKVKASLKEGMLELQMPKLEGAKRRKIQVQ